MRATRAAALAALAALGACERERAVRVLLGPDDRTLTRGLACLDEDGAPLARRALAGGRLRFQLVVDLIGLGGGVPGCRGEELLAWCEAEGCQPVELPGGRYCVPLDLGVSADLPALVGEIYAQLRAAPPVVEDAPEEPVVVRAVATVQSCEELAAGAALRPEALVGCAYSCPVQLDGVDEVQLFLDTLSDRCVREVEACARFPR